MKKLIYLLMLMAAPIFATSCTSDDDLPEVVITMNVDGLWQLNGQYYGVVGEPIKIESLSAAGLGGNPAALSNVNYFWDDTMIGSTIVSPYTFTIETDGLTSGRDMLTAQMMILQQDKTVVYGALNVGISMVESQEDLPDGVTPLTVIETQMTPGSN